MSETGNSKKNLAIAALLQNRTVTDAAKACGVSARTLYRWCEDKDFQDALKVAQQSAVSSTVRVLSELTGTAVSTLKSVMTNAKTPFGVKVRAAEVVLSRFESLRDSVDFDERLANIERVLKLGGTHEQK